MITRIEKGQQNKPYSGADQNRFALTGFKLSFNTSYNVQAPGLTLYNWGGVGKGEAYDTKCQVYWMYMYCFVFRLIGLYCTWGNGVLGGGGGQAFTCKWGTCYLCMAVYSLMNLSM